MTRRRVAVAILCQLVVLLGCGTLFPAIFAYSVGATTAVKARVGPGYTDVSPHQLVRTSGNVVYTVAPTCDVSYPCIDGTRLNSLRVFRADTAGLATTYTEQDTARRPIGKIASSAAAVDGSDLIHVIFNDQQGTGSVVYRTFDTSTNLWGAAATLDTASRTNYQQGDEGVALALDSTGSPHVVWASMGDGSAVRLYYAKRVGQSWTTPLLLDDGAAAPTGNFRSMHPAVAFTAQDEFVVAWLRGTFNGADDGEIFVRVRRPDGSWEGIITLPDIARTTIDNGPSLLITPDGTRHITFLSGVGGHEDEIRYWYATGINWRGDQQPPIQITHNPSLGPDGGGGFYLYGHGTPVGGPDGHGDNLYRFHKSAGGSWEPWTLYATGSLDGSVSTRWSQFFQFFPQTLDIAYWADTYPDNILYVGSETIDGMVSGTIAPLPPTRVRTLSPAPTLPLPQPPTRIAPSVGGASTPNPAPIRR